MSNTNETKRKPITEGPFSITLDAPIRPGSTTTKQISYILGGPDGTTDKLPEILNQIDQLPRSNFSDLQKGAKTIFQEHGLERVDK